MLLRQERGTQMECSKRKELMCSFLTGQRTLGVLNPNLGSRIRKCNYSVFDGFTSSICYLPCDLGGVN